MDREAMLTEYIKEFDLLTKDEQTNDYLRKYIEETFMFNMYCLKKTYLKLIKSILELFIKG